MRIVQFTDVHIAADGIDTFGVDVRENFTKALKKIVKLKPDKVVLSGDLCFKEPDVAVYKWIREALETYGVKPLIIPGNHDDNSELAQYFDLELIDDEIYFRTEVGGIDCLFLDTGRGVMSEKQLSWLKTSLIQGEPSMIFMHHPPIDCGVPYMDDNHAFRGTEEFLNAIHHYSMHLPVFCGHYHVDRVVHKGNLSVIVTPSTFFQIRSDQAEFGIDHYRPGIRVIDIVHGGYRHWVEYLP